MRAHRAVAAAGQADLVWGHVSVRDPDGRGAWMKAAVWGFEEVDDERVVLVASSGAVVEGVGPRHLGFPVHTEILWARPDVHCVVHTHSAAATAFASLRVPVRAIDHDGVLFAEPDVPRFTRTGALISTPELDAELAGVVGDARACLLARHSWSPPGRTWPTRSCSTAPAASSSTRWPPAAPSPGRREAEVKRAECWPPSQIEAGWRYLNRLAEQENRFGPGHRARRRARPRRARLARAGRRHRRAAGEDRGRGGRRRSGRRRHRVGAVLPRSRGAAGPPGRGPRRAREQRGPVLHADDEALLGDRRAGVESRARRESRARGS